MPDLWAAVAFGSVVLAVLGTCTLLYRQVKKDGATEAREATERANNEAAERIAKSEALSPHGRDELVQRLRDGGAL